MPQTGAAGFRRSDRHGDAPPPPIVGFDPVGEITARDRRGSTRGRAEAAGASASASAAAGGGGSGAGRVEMERGRREVRDARWAGEDSRAAARAAMAEAFAAQFGVDEASPSAAAMADRFGFRFEDSANGPAGRRTITITGHGAARSVPPAERSVRPGGGEARRRAGRSEPIGLNADRVALWAVGLAIVLALVAAMSAHAIPH